MHRRNCNLPKHLRCEALLRDSYGRPTNDRCGCYASVVVQKKRLCSKHAAMHTLNLALKSGSAKELPFTRALPSTVRFVGQEL